MGDSLRHNPSIWQKELGISKILELTKQELSKVNFNQWMSHPAKNSIAGGQEALGEVPDLKSPVTYDSHCVLSTTYLFESRGFWLFDVLLIFHRQNWSNQLSFLDSQPTDTVDSAHFAWIRSNWLQRLFCYLKKTFSTWITHFLKVLDELISKVPKFFVLNDFFLCL